VSGQALDLMRSATILWRHKLVVATLIMLGLVANTAYTLAQPETYTSSALVTVSSIANTASQAVVATSVPVLSDVLRTADLGLSLKTLHDRVQARPANALPIISISAEASTARQAEQTANAVAHSYLAYVTSAQNPSGRQAAELTQRAATSIAKPRTTRVLQAAGIGFLVGALVALIAVLAIGRGDRRLRTRNAIADSIGIPVLASVHAKCPDDIAGWMKLLGRYNPKAADAWQLDNALRSLGIRLESGQSRGHSVAVLSLSGDKNALALGAQLAASAAAQGISTALVIDRLHATKPATALRAACGAGAGQGPGQGPSNLLVTEAGHDALRQVPAQSLTVVVEVVDAKAPHVADTTHADAAVLAVTAGVVTAEQLARVVASAAGTGLGIVGVMVVNPDPADQTTGRLPQLARSEQQGMPTRVTV
jgi:capsular polysaccharide biosynthesis protein